MARLSVTGNDIAAEVVFRYRHSTPSYHGERAALMLLRNLGTVACEIAQAEEVLALLSHMPHTMLFHLALFSLGLWPAHRMSYALALRTPGQQLRVKFTDRCRFM